MNRTYKSATQHMPGRIQKSQVKKPLLTKPLQQKFGNNTCMYIYLQREIRTGHKKYKI